MARGGFAQKCNLKAGGINIELPQFLDEGIISKYSETEYMKYGDIVVNSTKIRTLGRVGLCETIVSTKQSN